MIALALVILSFVNAAGAFVNIRNKEFAWAWASAYVSLFCLSVAVISVLKTFVQRVVE